VQLYTYCGCNDINNQSVLLYTAKLIICTVRNACTVLLQHTATAIYVRKQELTRSSKHPLGGQASLSLDDQEVM
jgi:hypothetical protein